MAYKFNKTLIIYEAFVVLVAIFYIAVKYLWALHNRKICIYIWQEFILECLYADWDFNNEFLLL